MLLVRLIYASRVRPGFNVADIERVLTVSRRNNAAKDITGMLCFDSRCLTWLFQAGDGASWRRGA